MSGEPNLRVEVTEMCFGLHVYNHKIFVALALAESPQINFLKLPYSLF